jgi:hypothetical protein
MKDDKKGFYIGKFISEDGDFWEYRKAFIQNIERTIPEYGLNKDWVQAQQVIAYSRGEVLKDFSRGLVGEVINYNSPFPTMSMREATDIIIERN